MAKMSDSQIGLIFSEYFARYDEKSSFWTKANESVSTDLHPQVSALGFRTVIVWCGVIYVSAYMWEQY